MFRGNLIRGYKGHLFYANNDNEVNLVQLHSSRSNEYTNETKFTLAAAKIVVIETDFENI